MIFFNWAEILRLTKYNCKLSLNVLKCISKLKKPSNLENTILLKSYRHTQHNWLNNPKYLLYCNFTDNEKCVYIDIASRRNYYLFLSKNITYLPTYFIDNNLIDKLKLNKLLRIEDDKIFFDY